MRNLSDKILTTYVWDYISDRYQGTWTCEMGHKNSDCNQDSWKQLSCETLTASLACFEDPPVSIVRRGKDINEAVW